MTQLQQLKEDGSACQYMNKDELLVVRTTVVTEREKQRRGTFKVAYMATTDQPLFGRNERTVCTKQTYQKAGDGVMKIYSYKDQKL